MRIAKKIVNQELVEYLEQILARAEAGEITAFVAVGRVDGFEHFNAIYGLTETEETLKFMGMVDVLRHRLLMGIIESLS